jgi:(p)ppGpp synthase/HD superfamily hydrolase
MNNNFLNTFTKALNFAAFKHRNQRRKSGDIPYINHPI